MLEPVPTLLISPVLTRDLADVILLHPYEGEYDRIGSKGSDFLWYLPLKTPAKRESGLSINLHSCFANNVVLKF